MKHHIITILLLTDIILVLLALYSLHEVREMEKVEEPRLTQEEIGKWPDDIAPIVKEGAKYQLFTVERTTNALLLKGVIKRPGTNRKETVKEENALLYKPAKRDKSPLIAVDLGCNTWSIRTTDYFLDDNKEIDTEKIDAYVERLADMYNTYNSIRNFTTHTGEVIQVGGSQDISDTYGFSLDTYELYDQLVSAVLGGNGAIIDAPWEVPAIARNQENGDIGDTYIEISLAEQHLWYWIGGELFLDTDIVTGMPTPGRHTPAGVFRIWNKATNVNLIGSVDGDSWDSFVNYWMSVTWNEIGMHDAPWRGSDPSGYGGNIYTYNGSHGCINLPYGAEEDIFYTVELDTPVIIY